MKNFEPHSRYQRQLPLKELGVAGQQKLNNAKVLVAGAGGLGSPVIQYLAGAGVGTIGVVDYDVVALHNLHRQTIYTTQDVGAAKVEAAVAFIRRLNPEINAVAHFVQLTAQNALNILEDYDMIIDGTDNFATRYMLNDACVLLGKPLVFGAVAAFEIQLAVFNYTENITGKRSVNYRDIFPTPPAENEVPNCNESGVLGVVPGLAGMWMASECIKLITGAGEPLINQMLVYNVLNHQHVILQFSENTNSRSSIPDSRNAFEKMDYQQLCDGADQFEIDVAAFNALLQADTNVIDVREPGEMPAITDFLCQNIPLQQLGEKAHTLQQKKIVLFCQSGKRSRVAARMLREVFGDSREIYSLKGGIVTRQTASL